MKSEELTISRAYVPGHFPIKITITHIPTGSVVMGTGRQEDKLIKDLKVILQEKVATLEIVEDLNEKEPILGTIKLRKKWTRKVKEEANVNY
jgi:hypothetical protein